MPDPLTPEQFYDLIARARLHPAAAVQLASAVDDLLAERARLQARLDDAHSVIRRLLNNWTLDAIPRWTPAEADAITRAIGGGRRGLFPEIAADRCPDDPMGEGTHYFGADNICIYCHCLDMLLAGGDALSDGKEP